MNRDMHHISNLQASRNTDSRDGWECFAPHREQVTRLLVDAVTTANPTLCVLGAGNCNDLDLSQLVTAYTQVNLVDIDGDAITAGLTRQAIGPVQIVVRGGTDVTGIADALSTWDSARAPTNDEIDALVELARHATTSMGGEQFNTVASVCLLSQLLEAVTLHLDQTHPRFLELLTCVRREHIRLMIDLIEPGGSFILVTDIVSSLTVPQLDTATHAELPRLVQAALTGRNFFTGMNPAVIAHLLSTDEGIAPRLQHLQVINPWVWDLGPRRYAVCAMTARRV